MLPRWFARSIWLERSLYLYSEEEEHVYELRLDRRNESWEISVDACGQP